MRPSSQEAASPLHPEQTHSHSCTFSRQFWQHFSRQLFSLSSLWQQWLSFLGSLAQWLGLGCACWQFLRSVKGRGRWGCSLSWYFCSCFRSCWLSASSILLVWRSWQLWAQRRTQQGSSGRMRMEWRLGWGAVGWDRGKQGCWRVLAVGSIEQYITGIAKQHKSLGDRPCGRRSFESAKPPLSTSHLPAQKLSPFPVCLPFRQPPKTYPFSQCSGEVLIIFAAPSIKMMLSSLRLTTFTGIGREEEKKLSLILTYLIDMPEATEFIHPVDWQQLELNDYPLVVKHPMNLLKVQDKLKSREYRSVEEVLDHIQLVWDNCKAYNPEGPFFVLADKMERAFKKMIRNYLPSIQVIVPKPANSAPQHPPNPPPQPAHHAPKSQPRPATRAPAPVVSAPSNQNLNSYEEPASVNEQGENVAQPEEVPQSEKNRLHQRLKQLTQQDLAHVVTLIQEGCPEGFKQLGGGRYQMLLDCLDLETFRRVNQRIDDLLDADKGVAGSKKVKL